MTIPLIVLPNISGNENISEIWLYSQKQDLKGKFLANFTYFQVSTKWYLFFQLAKLFNDFVRVQTNLF